MGSKDHNQTVLCSGLVAEGDVFSYKVKVGSPNYEMKNQSYHTQAPSIRNFSLA